MPGSWLLGHVFGPAMLALGGALFFSLRCQPAGVGGALWLCREPASERGKRMMRSTTSQSAGYAHNGLPYNRFGRGLRPLIVFQGLMFENKPQYGLTFSMYRFLEDEYTVYIVLRKPGLPVGYTMQDMADDYAAMIRQEFGGPVDVIGVSTGGSIALHFAADHPDLARRLVIHSSAHALGDEAKQVQLEVGRLAQQGRWRAAYAAMSSFMLPRAGMMKSLARPMVWLGSGLMTLMGTPQDPNDLVVTVEAEDKHNFKDRLGEITTPTLVIAGAQDPFYSPALFQETANGIPNARLVLYEKMRHPAMGKQFERDVLEFLREWE
ncbi:MAG: alpha/beta hydrolase [Anaerolineae bacterium]|nr:alpha/beta hydrolase [Anaerolineae bacterium]